MDAKIRNVGDNDIHNGMVLRNIYDNQNLLLIKKGSKVSEAHYSRLRSKGFVNLAEVTLARNANRGSAKSAITHATNDNSLHGRLAGICQDFQHLQQQLIETTDREAGKKLRALVFRLQALCEEDIHQVLGELFASSRVEYTFTKPLYIAASLNELINRYQQYLKNRQFDELRRKQLLLAALSFNLGLIFLDKEIYANREEITPEKKLQLRRNYPNMSAEILKAAGIEDPVTVDAVLHHNVASVQPSDDALLLRTPFTYVGIAMPQSKPITGETINNPCREFALMFTKQELNPVYGGLFLKINGLAPIGSIINLETREKALIVKGPDDRGIASSTFRLLTNKSGVQLNRPGKRFLLHESTVKVTGLSDHHEFAWNKYAPHLMWSS